MMNFDNNVDTNERKTGELNFEFRVNGRKLTQKLPTSDTIRNLSGGYHNPDNVERKMRYAVYFTNRSQIIVRREFVIPPRGWIFLSFEFNSNGVSDIDSVIRTSDDKLVSPHFMLGSHELHASDGLAGGKLLFEIESLDGDSDTRSVEYTLNDHDMVLDLQAYNVSSDKRFRLTIRNCFLYNSDGQNLLDFKEIMQVAFFPDDLYNLQIRINANGTIAASYERI